MLDKTYKQFVKEFNIVDNALDMRDLRRWNGRNLRKEENLSEHTHLVVACTIELYDEYKKSIPALNFEEAIRMAMLHDSLEILRGDILTVTKNRFPEIKKLITDEEDTFKEDMGIFPNASTYDLVVLADNKACYKYLEKQMEYPSNDFCKQAYIESKKRYDTLKTNFEKDYLNKSEEVIYVKERFMKGYEDDAGVDIILDKKVTLLPMSTQTIDLGVQIIPKEGQMGVLCSRTSAANKGIITAMCPIDANYSGNVLAIVHNITNKIVEYDVGESFCQYCIIDIETQKNVKIKKSGKRTVSNLGGTDK